MDFPAVTVRAVEGAAGCGKTYRLMEMLKETLATHPLVDGQRVLALTFMHGARRRLADKLRKIDGLTGRHECRTIDGFAWRIYWRWRGLAAALGIPQRTQGEYDAVCDAAGMLLAQPQVREWAVASFPIMLVDEGQDLRPERLRMLIALSNSAHALIAADEFQCLDQDLRPNPLVEWLQVTCIPESLTLSHRTDIAALLAAAAAIRDGKVPTNGTGFQILPSLGAPYGAAQLANAITWHSQGRDVAVITPVRHAKFVKDVVARVCERPCGRHGNGPYPIHWEGTVQSHVEAIKEALDMAPEASGAEAISALRQLFPSGAARATRAWVEIQMHACGRNEFTRTEIEEVIGRNVEIQQQCGQSSGHRYTALTVHQAKNREFDGVVVLWPYEVGGDVVQKRRLLYNAITRAKRWCNVIVQHESILKSPPFH